MPGDGYASWSGTSMAAPFVAGTLALVRAADPRLSPLESVERVREGAARIDGP